MKGSAETAMMGGGGLASAALSLLYLLPIPGLAFLSYFSPLPFFLLGLSYGLRPLYGAVAIATLLVGISGGFFMGSEFFIFSGLGPAFLVNRALLNRVTPSKKRNWYPASFLLRDLTFAAGLIMLIGLGVYLYFTHGGDKQDVVTILLKNLDPQNQIREIEPLLKAILPLLPGFFALSWAVMMLINGTLAQGLLVRFQRNIRPSPTLKDLEAPKMFLILLGLSFLLSFIGLGPLELLGKNTALIMVFPFFLIGLGLVHVWLHKTSYASLGLTLFYFLLILLIWPALFVIFLGILKPWVEKSLPSSKS